MTPNFADGQTIGERDEQQDYKGNLIIHGGYMLYVLADGMGGHVGGALASKVATNSFLRYFEEHGVVDADISQNLRLALEQANEALTDVLRENSSLNGMGTTLVALVHKLTSNRYWFLSVGDSPLYKQTKQGLIRLNVNHAYYEDLLVKVKNGEISQQEADEHPNRHAITSAVMGKKLSLVDVQSGQIEEGELILLASDGVQTLNDLQGGKLEQLLRATKNSDLEASVSSILTAVAQKKHSYQDNTSLILIGYFKEKTTPVISPKTIDLDKETSTTKPIKNQQARLNKTNNKIIILMIALLLVLTAIIFFMLGSAKPTQDPVSETTPIQQESTITIPEPKQQESTITIPEPEQQESTITIPEPEQQESTITIPEPEQQESTKPSTETKEQNGSGSGSWWNPSSWFKGE